MKPELDRQPVLEGELVRLRPLVEDDYDELYAVASDPMLWEQHPSKERASKDGFRHWFDDLLMTGGTLVVIDRQDDAIIGASRYGEYDHDRNRVEIGWTFLARSHWGGIYNGEMKALMLRHAFKSVDAVIFRVHSQNFRSQRAVEKLGAHRIGTEIDPLGRGENVIFRLVRPDNWSV